MLNQKKSETEYLLHLVFCALHDEEPKKAEGVDFCALFELAKQQEIYCLINEKLQGLDFVCDEAKALFRNQTLSELNRMIALGAERKAVFSKLSEKKICFMPLKGLVFKDYYPKESMRQMSDNDILIDETKRTQAAEIMAELSYNAYDTTQNSDDFFKKPFYTFELHRSLFDENGDFSPRFDDVWKNAKQDEGNEYLYHMGKEDVYIFSVCHMYKHYIKACCGIRFLIDNYLFIKKEESSLNWNYIERELDKHGLFEYENQTRRLAKAVFEEQELSDYDNKLLESYTDFGLFGNRQGRILQDYMHSSGGSKGKTRLKYILHRLFPKRKEIISSYPVLEKAPILYPFMLIHRFFKGLFNIRKTTDELKTVEEIQKENRG
ncbi:MAG: nucleotidyltransferase family protein [Eubacterium sp.]|nr:nucleotidyltransferase family protein [Eubacterium sp.]